MELTHYIFMFHLRQTLIGKPPCGTGNGPYCMLSLSPITLHLHQETFHSYVVSFVNKIWINIYNIWWIFAAELKMIMKRAQSYIAHLFQDLEHTNKGDATIYIMTVKRSHVMSSFQENFLIWAFFFATLKKKFLFLRYPFQILHQKFFWGDQLYI